MSSDARCHTYWSVVSLAELQSCPPVAQLQGTDAVLACSVSWKLFISLLQSINACAKPRSPYRAMSAAPKRRSLSVSGQQRCSQGRSAKRQQLERPVEPRQSLQPLVQSVHSTPTNAEQEQALLQALQSAQEGDMFPMALAAPAAPAAEAPAAISPLYAGTSGHAQQEACQPQAAPPSASDAPQSVAGEGRRVWDAGMGHWPGLQPPCIQVDRRCKQPVPVQPHAGRSRRCSSGAAGVQVSARSRQLAKIPLGFCLQCCCVTTCTGLCCHQPHSQQPCQTLPC